VLEAGMHSIVGRKPVGTGAPGPCEDKHPGAEGVEDGPLSLAVPACTIGLRSLKNHCALRRVHDFAVWTCFDFRGFGVSAGGRTYDGWIEDVKGSS
jgi:hypothetical protein